MNRTELEGGWAPGSLFEAVVATVRQPLLVLDPQLHIVVANTAFQQSFGLTASPVGLELAAIEPLRHAGDMRRLLETLPADRVVQEFEASIELGGEMRVFVVSARLIPAGEEPLSCFAFEDITFYYDTLAAEREHSAGLERRVAERTSELEAFSYSVSHDLRAPLRALDGFSRILLEDHAGELSPEATRYLEMIRDSAVDMTALIDGLLAFSRLGRQGIEVRQVDVGPIVHAVVFELLAVGDLDESIVSIGNLGSVRADGTLIRQVFANLIGNALKYSRNEPAPHVEVGRRAEDGVFYVRDNGVGFDMAYAGKLFGMFQRLHLVDDFEGSGIGLALASRIVERHGGKIWADAEPGRGATFFFTMGEDA